MKKATMTKFKKLFEEKRNSILFHDKIIREDFLVNMDDRYDELDQASTDVEQSMRMRLRNREHLYLKKIEEALARIEEGIFGLCEMCEEPIELRRLMARPTATLCVSCKENEERDELQAAGGRRSKSLGEEFKKNYA